jgi:hypothetical protein
VKRVAWRTLAVVLAIVAAPFWALFGAWAGLQELWENFKEFWCSC